MERTKLVVFKEHTLGYILPELPDYVQILEASILRGATFRMFPDSDVINNPSDVRLATEQDFEDYRCQFSEVYRDENKYEYAKYISRCTFNSNCEHHNKSKECLNQDVCPYKWPYKIDKNN